MIGITVTGMILILLYIALTCRREAEYFSHDRIWLRGFKSSGYFFYRKVVCRWIKQDAQTENQTYKNMQQLYCRRDVSQEWREYQAGKYACIIAGIFAVLLAGTVFILVGGYMADQQTTVLQRPSYGEEAEEIVFQIQEEDGTAEEVHLVLESQIYSREEAEELFEACYTVLKEKVKGENTSLQEVRTDLDFEPAEGWEGISVIWTPSDYSLVTDEGTVQLDQAEEGENELQLYLSLSHEQYQQTYEIPIVIVKDSSDVGMDLETYLKNEQEGSREQEIFELPDTFEDKVLTYTVKPDYSMAGGLVLLIAAVVILFLCRQKSSIQEQCARREQQMRADYPEIISKLLILIRAGMPIRSAWVQIVDDYYRQKKKNGVVHYAMEEMELAVHDMENGVSEGTAYFNFGKRCGFHLYLKLGSMLEQNLKKGSYGLSSLLENERIQAQEDRKRQIRMAGEAAGTKLMMPMMILFVLVLAIIMVPSLMSLS